VNTVLTMYLARTMKEAGPLLLAGLIIVAIGAVLVLVAKPAAHPAAKVTVEEKSITVVYKTIKDEKEVEEKVTAPDAAALRELDRRAYRIYQESNVTFFDNVMVTLFVVMTALAWGAYGPTLHKGQTAMRGSRLRPFLCVGLAYLVIAVVVPVLLLQAGISDREAEADFTFAGTIWSLAGGTVGAIGALGIIMAFNAGGKPIYVMPLVFGGAPVVNSFTEIVAKSMYHEIGPLFYAGLILVVVGAVMVLVFAPKHHPPKPTPEPSYSKVGADIT
jgi:MFS family permease